MLENRIIRILFIALTGLAIAAYISGLSIDVTRDAGKYATVSKEIFHNKNYINITVHGEPYDQKPPMLFWLGALGFSIGKLSNFWFKFPVFLLTLFGFYSAYGLGRSLYNRRVGLLTAFMLAFSLISTLYSMDIHADTPMQAFIAFALWQFAEFIQTKKDKHWILGFAGVGFAMLSKGPVGAVIPALAVAGHILMKKDFRLLLNYRWYLGILLSFVILSPALAGLYNQFGRDGLIFFFWDNNVGRFTGSYIQATNDPLFYVHSLIYLFLPWSLLFFVSAFMEFKTLIRNKFKSPEYFTFTGIWIFFFILNASKNQLPNYIFGIMPLIAVLTAKWTDIALTQKQKLLKVYYSIQNIITAILWLAIGFIAFYLFPVSGWQMIVISLFGIGSTIYIFTNCKSYIPKLILPSAIAFISLAWQLNNDVFPYIFSHQAPPKAARYFTENAKPGETLFNYNYSQYELFFYSEPQAKQLSSDEEMKSVAGNSGNWIFTDSEGFEKIAELNLKTDTIIEYRHLYLNKGIEFIPPKNRKNVLYPMYLIKY